MHLTDSLTDDPANLTTRPNCKSIIAHIKIYSKFTLEPKNYGMDKLTMSLSERKEI